MDHVTHEGVELDRCAAGHGMWIDRTELVRVVMDEGDRRPAAEQAAELEAARSAGLGTVMEAIRSEGTRTCPQCGKAMTKLQYADYSAIVVDECAEHGTWLDGDELQRIEAYAEGFRAARR
jgi:Zn-finger nucleic acid-binding protein